MSYEAMSWAWQLDLPSSQKFIVLALANYADQDASCYPGHERLADMTGLSVRSVGRNLRELEDMGVFTRERRARRNGSGRTSDRYYLDLSWKAENVPLEDGNATPCPVEPNPPQCPIETDFNRPNGAVSTRHHVQGYIREPLEPINHKKNPQTPMAEPAQGELDVVAESAPPAGGGSTRKRSEYPAEFEAFWDVYPKKSDKRAALKAWRSALNRGVTNESLITGAEMYRHDPNRDEQFTKNAATWLNADAWENDPLPTRGGAVNKTDLKQQDQMAILDNLSAYDNDQQNQMRRLG